MKNHNLSTGHHVGRARRWRRERTLLAALRSAAGSAVAALSDVLDAEEAVRRTLRVSASSKTVAAAPPVSTDTLNTQVSVPAGVPGCSELSPDARFGCDLFHLLGQVRLERPAPRTVAQGG